MGKFTIFCLAGFWLGSVLGSGDLGDVNKNTKALTAEQIGEYFTETAIVGRDHEAQQCSQRVLDYRKKYADKVHNFFGVIDASTPS